MPPEKTAPVTDLPITIARPESLEIAAIISLKRIAHD
jgi:hypothetical protein